MFQYRQAIHRMRMGESDRAIAQTRLIGRLKCAQVRAIAEEKGWLADGPLLDDAELANVFVAGKIPNPTHVSLSLRFRDQVREWMENGVCWTTIHQTLVDRSGRGKRGDHG